ncbi:DUF2779 domain-containing protein, partial [Planktothrix sp.]
INTEDCFFPHLENLFVFEDVSDRVNSRLEDISYKIEDIKQILTQYLEPQVFIGKHCNHPHACNFKKSCWKDIPKASIFTIPRLSSNKIDELVQSNIFDIEDIPIDFELTPKQQNYVDLVLANHPDINSKEIQKVLSHLKYPLHFFDIETHNPAIPRFNGLKPYEQFIFQYSCHILQKDGSVQHYEYLHTEYSDPRIYVIQSLINHIQSTGTIVVYHKSFEGSILTKLGNAFPEYESFLLSIVNRLWDLEEIFKKYYKHPYFYGQTSIKKVLPVLVPSLSYDILDIKRGDEAQAMWDLMINTVDDSKKNKIIQNLKDYCQLDTLAMVKIYQALLKV